MRRVPTLGLATLLLSTCAATLASAEPPRARQKPRQADQAVLRRALRGLSRSEESQGRPAPRHIEHRSRFPRDDGDWEEIMGRIEAATCLPRRRLGLGPRGRASRGMDRRPASRGGSLRQTSAKERVLFRRLSREEYANTLRDLLGVTFDATDPTGLPEDPEWHGFQRIGSVLTLSPAHVEKYLAAAETVLNKALPGPSTEGKSYAGHRSRYRLERFRKGVPCPRHRGQGARRHRPNNGTLDSRTLNIKTPGEYLVRIQLSGLRPKGGRAPRLRLYASDIGRLLFEQDWKPRRTGPLEFRTHLPAGSHPIRIVNAVPGPNPEARRSRRAKRQMPSPICRAVSPGR